MPSDVVGIKINPIGGRKLSTNQEVVSAIVKGLMLTGVKENNIIVWDKEEKHLLEAGYVARSHALRLGQMKVIYKACCGMKQKSQCQSICSIV